MNSYSQHIGKTKINGQVSRNILPKLNKKIDNLNRLITRIEIESVKIFFLQTKSSTGWLCQRILPNIQRIYASSSQLFQKTEEKGTLSKAFSEATIT